MEDTAKSNQITDLIKLNYSFSISVPDSSKQSSSPYDSLNKQDEEQ